MSQGYHHDHTGRGNIHKEKGQVIGRLIGWEAVLEMCVKRWTKKRDEKKINNERGTTKTTQKA